MADRHLAALCRSGMRHLSADTSAAADLSPAVDTAEAAAEIDAALTALDAARHWPAGQAAQRYDFQPTPTVATGAAGPDICLWCTAAWWQSVSEVEMGIDLAAATNPADWLLRMETRLLERSPTDPGVYAALACWTGVMPSEG